MRFLRRKQVPVEPLPRYADVFDVMRYEQPEGVPEFALPSVYAFRTKPIVQTPDPRPSFAFLETADEIDAWHRVLAEVIVLNGDGHLSDLPLLRWNNIPSLLTSDDVIIATYAPAEEGEGWPSLVVQTHAPDADLPEKPARDRYYFEQNKFFGVL